MKNLSILFVLLFFWLFSLSQIQIGQDIDGEATGDESGSSVSLNSDGTVVSIGGWRNSSMGNYAGHTRIYSWNGVSWVQMGADIDAEAGGDNCGYSVSLNASGTVVAIGSPENDGAASGAGHTRIFEWTGSTWGQRGSDIDGEASGDQSGHRVSLSDDGNTVVIVSRRNSGNGYHSGNTRVFSWNGLSWSQKGQNLYGEASADYPGGVSISSDGNTVAVGASSNDGNGLASGHCRVFSWDGLSWIQKGGDIDGESNGDQSGSAIDLSGDGNTIIIAAVRNEGNGAESGHARVLSWNGTFWVQKGSDIDGEFPGDWAGTGISMSDDGNMVAIGSKNNDENGNNSGHTRLFFWGGTNWTQIGNDIFGEDISDFSGTAVSLSGDGKSLAIGAKLNDGNGASSGHTRVYKVNGLYGKVYNDLVSGNCLLDTFEPGVGGYTGIINPGGIVITTNIDGFWFLDSLPIGSYTLTLAPSTSWDMPCGNSISFNLTDPDSLTYAGELGLTSNFPCPEPDISVHMPFMRNCFDEQMIYVQACNAATATGILENAWSEVELPPLLSLDSASLPFIHLGGNVFSFQLADTLIPGQCIDFTISTTVSCSTVMNQTLCIQANIYPADSCVFDTVPSLPPGTVTPCTLPWDKSSLNVEGWCANDSVYFTIENTGDPGDGDMDCFAPVNIYLDGQFVQFDSIQLLGGEIITYVLAGNGQTWHLETDQHPLHPGNSNPNATVELCGDHINWTPGLVSVFPNDDADPVVDIFCGQVTGSYDPNDKQGFPTGLTESHYIEPGQQMEYVIRFQNTGNDTAFTVIIRDTLGEDLDIFSVVSGVTSHPSVFRMYGPRVLEWRFDNIMLPDSFVNETASHGFVTFTVDQTPGLSNGTEINNSAAIYFDYNDPILTNQTSHMVCRPGFETVVKDTCDSFTWLDGMTYNTSTSVNPLLVINPDGCYTWTSLDLKISESSLGTDVQTACDSYSWIDGNTYTNSNNTATYILENVAGCDSIVTLDLTIETISNMVSLNGNTLTAEQSGANLQWVTCSDMEAIPGETTDSFSPEYSGDYAVIISEGSCQDTSECVNVQLVGKVSEISGSVKIFPNPTSGKLYIEFPSPVSDPVIRLTDLTGKILLEVPFSGSRERLSIDSEQLSNGIYFLNIRSERCTHQKKVVIMK